MGLQAAAYVSCAMNTEVLSRLLRNIFGAGAVSVVSMLVAFFSVPLLLGLLGKTQYGTWVTLTSMLSWIMLFDLGVGYSLRNTVAGLGIRKSVNEVLVEFLGLFRFVFLVVAVLLLFFVVAGPFVALIAENRLVASLLYPVYLLAFPFALGGSVLQGSGRVALQSVLQAASTWLFFTFILVCHLVAFAPPLGLLAAVFSLSFAFCVALGFMLALRLLNGLNRGVFSLLLGPVPFGRVKVGITFLVLQVSSLMLYGLGNLIVYHELGPDEVARYDVINKIFQVGLSFYSVVISVMWAEISRLIALGETRMLRKMHIRLLAVAALFSLCAFLFSAVAPWIIGMWTRHAVYSAPIEVMATAFLVSCQAFAYAGAVFLNAFERVGIQVSCSAVVLLLMVPASVFLLRSGYGIASVPFSAAFLTIPAMLVCNIYAFRLLREGVESA